MVLFPGYPEMEQTSSERCWIYNLYIVVSIYRGDTNNFYIICKQDRFVEEERGFVEILSFSDIMILINSHYLKLVVIKIADTMP